MSNVLLQKFNCATSVRQVVLISKKECYKNVFGRVYLDLFYCISTYVVFEKANKNSLYVHKLPKIIYSNNLYKV